MTLPTFPAHPLAYLALLATPIASAQDSVPPPVAKKVPHVRDIHGERFVDNYFWFRDRKNPDVLTYLKASNAHADSFMASTKALQDTLYKEIVGHIQETDLSVPVLDRGYYYYSRTVKGQQYEIYCRRKGSMKAREEVMLDLNALGKGKPYIDAGQLEVSPNGRILAYTLDTTGYREYQLYFKDLMTGRVYPDRFGKVNGVTWCADNRTVYYTTEDAAKRPDKLYRRALGQKSGTLLYHEKVPQYNLWAEESRDHRYLFVTSASAETSECRLVPLSSAKASLKLIERRREGVEYYPDHRNGTLYLRTNDGAKEWKVVAAPIAKPGRAHWKPVVSERENATITGLELFERYMVLNVRENAVESTRIHDFKSGTTHTVKFPESYYSAGLSANPDFGTKTFRMSYVSQITPRTIYDYDPARRTLTVVKRQPVRNYDPSKYTASLLWVSVRDGERVPVAIAHRKGVTKPAPMLLEAYGAYGAPNDPGFSVANLALMDRGVIVASALVRGGGEMGDRWHDAGKMKNKLTTFTDFIDCAKDLTEKEITNEEKLAITGGSAGGLTMGAVLNMAPEISRCALVYVPFVDVINTMLDETLPLTTQEFLEWGNPKKKEEYGWMRSYSPYDNVGALDYPAMLVRTSLNDSQVPYWEATKWVAKLRELRTDDDPLLLKVNLDAGHGGASGRYDAITETAYDFAFLLRMLGVESK